MGCIFYLNLKNYPTLHYMHMRLASIKIICIPCLYGLFQIKLVKPTQLT